MLTVVSLDTDTVREHKKYKIQIKVGEENRANLRKYEEIYMCTYVCVYIYVILQ